MACESNYGPVLPQETCDEMASHYPMCKKLLQRCYETKTPLSCATANTFCYNKIEAPYSASLRNDYDIRDKCQPNCYPILKDMATYLNIPEVQVALGVHRNFQFCQDLVMKKFTFTADGALPQTQNIVDLLEDGISVLIYAGDADW
ncbi:hypothetical protein HK099_001058 [Clydaea vesicula]|uniref:Uncharacterized protein n=1 Tax=Clydaea vesicula TaxID=447962 RepID=A0AAD5TU11_9FUNG|nr:hypothetical protein HK099_001058 [Clydaea vesicula]